MTLLFTLVFSVAILCLLFWIFIRVKTPYYRVDQARMARVIESVLTGQATHNDWQMTFGMVIRHSVALESIRLQCVSVEEKYYIGDIKPPYLFSPTGLEELQIILRELNLLEKNITVTR
jgi:hypothetical protein